MSVLFGVAGNSDTFTETVSKASADAPAWLHAIGLDAYEYQCGKGVRVGEATARQIGENAAQAGITLSLHAPYFISLANPDPETVQKSIGYVTASCRAAQWMGADRVILHSGALMKRTRREALDIAKTNLKAILAACAEQGFEDVTLCPETMGKINQLGDLTEVLELCQVDERLVPCVDWAFVCPFPGGTQRRGRLQGHAGRDGGRTGGGAGISVPQPLLQDRLHSQRRRAEAPALLR